MRVDATPLKPRDPARSIPGLHVQFTVGCAYWLAVLLLLQPGNLLAMARGDVPVPWVGEALRIAGAALMGGAATPLLFVLTRRYPIEGRCWRRHAAIHALVLAALSFSLILLAQPLSTLLLPDRDPRLRSPLEVELASNGALLLAVLTVFTATLHAIRFLRREEATRAAAAVNKAGSNERVPVKTRGGVILAPLDEVDWIESQGNYLALHRGPKVHLIRDTLANFERRLDPQLFVRVHRRTIVRADRVMSLKHLTNGDGVLTLQDGTELRLSRNFRERANAVLALRPGGPGPAS